MTIFKTLTFSSLLLIPTGYVQAQAQQICKDNVIKTTPTSRFTVNADDGVVIDNKTRLIWKRCAQGQSGSSCSGDASLVNWPDALAQANNESFAGHDDWRLPNYKELESIIERACFRPSINSVVFPNTPNFRFWSSTPVSDISSRSFDFNFTAGEAAEVNRNFPHNVRLVRGEQ